MQIDQVIVRHSGTSGLLMTAPDTPMREDATAVPWPPAADS